MKYVRGFVKNIHSAAIASHGSTSSQGATSSRNTFLTQIEIYGLNLTYRSSAPLAIAPDNDLAAAYAGGGRKSIFAFYNHSTTEEGGAKPWHFWLTGLLFWGFSAAVMVLPAFSPYWSFREPLSGHGFLVAQWLCLLLGLMGIFFAYRAIRCREVWKAITALSPVRNTA